MTRNEITRRFPHASRSFIEANSDLLADLARLDPSKPESIEGGALVSPVARKATRRPRAAKGAHGSFEIRFTAYAVRPLDWDNMHIKELQDLLVKSGAIPGDDWATLSGRVRSRKVQTEMEERTEVEIIEL